MQDRFLAEVLRNRNNRAILDRWNLLALPDGWLVAGCLFQTVWNLQAGRPPEANIKDYDLFYHDPGDTSEAGESAGRPYEALGSACDGIDRFLVTSTCVGVRPGEVYAPYGLTLLYDGVLSMNPRMPHRELFDRKTKSYVTRWPWLRVD